MMYFMLRSIGVARDPKRDRDFPCEWHVGDAKTLEKIKNKCRITAIEATHECVEVQADGDELSLIEETFTNLPMAPNNRVVSWTGEHAKFILNNL